MCSAPPNPPPSSLLPSSCFPVPDRTTTPRPLQSFLLKVFFLSISELPHRSYSYSCWSKIFLAFLSFFLPSNWSTFSSSSSNPTACLCIVLPPTRSLRGEEGRCDPSTSILKSQFCLFILIYSTFSSHSRCKVNSFFKNCRLPGACPPSPASPPS